jgi:hypothetical protein
MQNETHDTKPKTVVKDVMIGLPCYDNRIEVDIYQECMNAVNDPTCVVGAIQHYNGDSLIPRGRNKLAKMFLDSGYKYLLFLDSDIRFQRWMINRLRSHDEGIVGGVYFKKKIPYAPVLNSLGGYKGELRIADEIGTGFMMIRRDVLGAMRTMWPEHDYKSESDEAQGTYHDWFRVGVYEGRYLSEDYYFCRLAGKLGYQSYIDTKIVTQHIGKMSFPMPDDTFVDGVGQLLKNVPEGSPTISDEKIEELAMQANRHADARRKAKASTSMPDPSEAPVVPIARPYRGVTNTTDTVATNPLEEVVV